MKVVPIGSVVVLCTLTCAARMSAAPTTAATAPSTRPDISAKINELLSKADVALTDGHYADARSAYLTVDHLDDGNVHALDGAAIASMHLKDPAQAKGLLEKALNKHPNATKSDRVTNFNLAAAALDAGQALRGAQALKAYLDAATGPADPPALDLLWTDIYAAEDAGPENEKSADDIDALMKFAAKYQDKVDALRPGMKRWGNSWRPGGEVDRSREQLARLEAEVSTSSRKLGEAQSLVKQRQQALDDVQNHGRHVGAVGDHRRALKNATEELEKAKTHHERVLAAAKAARPPLPKSFDPLTLDQTQSPGANDDAPVTQNPGGGGRRGHGKGK